MGTGAKFDDKPMTPITKPERSRNGAPGENRSRRSGQARRTNAETISDTPATGEGRPTTGPNFVVKTENPDSFLTTEHTILTLGTKPEAGKEATGRKSSE